MADPGGAGTSSKTILVGPGEVAPVGPGQVLRISQGSRPGERLHIRCDHAGLDQGAEPGGAVNAEVGQVHDGLHELLGPRLVQVVQQGSPPSPVRL